MGCCPGWNGTPVRDGVVHPTRGLCFSPDGSAGFDDASAGFLMGLVKKAPAEARICPPSPLPLPLLLSPPIPLLGRA